MRLVVRERMAPGVSARSGQLRSSHELPKIWPDRPILVQLCLDLLHSSDFAEIEATDAELVPALQAALADAPRTFTIGSTGLSALHVRGFPLCPRNRATFRSRMACAVFWTGCVVAAAHRRLEERAACGKIILKP